MIERYKNDKISFIFDELTRYQIMCDLEITYTNLILYKYNLKYLKRVVLTHDDVLNIKLLEQSTKHETAAVVDFLIKKTRCQYIHLDLTSSDILDSCLSIQINKSADYLLFKKISETISLLNELIDRFRGIKVVARTHGKNAHVMNLSNKFENYLYQIKHIYNKIVEVQLPVKFSGPVGARSLNSNIKWSQLEMENNFSSCLFDLENLCDDYRDLYADNYRPPSFENEERDTQIIPRSVYASLLLDVIQLYTVYSSIATDLRLMSIDGVNEFEESFEAKKQKGSSSMAHKRNPITLENTSGLVRMLHGYVPVILGNVDSWLERDISHSSTERMYVEDMFHLCCKISDNINSALNWKNFNTKRMEENVSGFLEKHGGNPADLLTEKILSGQKRKDAYKEIKEKQ